MVSFQSKIHARIIEKLEDDDFSGFSSASYVKSFLRKYSQLLELDLESEINQLDIVGFEKKDSYVSRESVQESLEMTEFSKKSDRYKKAEKKKGSPVFLVGSVVVLITALAGFYYLGSQANLPVVGAQDILEEFESQPQSFSRDREAKERLISEKTPLQPLATSLTTTSPLASPRSQRPARPVQPTSLNPMNSLIDPDSGRVRPTGSIPADQPASIENPDLKSIPIPRLDRDPMENRTPAQVDPRPLIDPSDNLF